jgi:ABC-type sugar transport system permease subunit
MQRYTIVHPLYLSFFSQSLYRDVARNWKGLCLTYLFALLALSVIPGVMTIQKDLTYFFNTRAPRLVSQFPTITISDGRVSISKPEPYYIKDEDTGKPVMIIDTTGSITSLKGSPAVILVTRTNIMVKTDKTETRTFDLSDVKHLVVDRRVIYDWMDNFQDWSAFVFYPLALAFSFFYHIIEVMFYSAIGLIFARSLQTHLHFRAIVRLAVMAVTPSIILGVLLAVSGLTVPYWWYISLTISTGYVYFAVRANSGKEAPSAA